MTSAMMKSYRFQQTGPSESLSNGMRLVKRNGQTYVVPEETVKASKERAEARRNRPHTAPYRFPESTYNDDYRPYPRDDAYSKFYRTARVDGTLQHTKRCIGENTTTYEDSYRPFSARAMQSSRFPSSGRLGATGTRPRTAGVKNASQIKLDRGCVADGDTSTRALMQSTYQHDFSNEISGYPVGFDNPGIRSDFVNYLKHKTWGTGRIDREVETMH